MKLSISLLLVFFISTSCSHTEKQQVKSKTITRTISSILNPEDDIKKLSEEISEVAQSYAEYDQLHNEDLKDLKRLLRRTHNFMEDLGFFSQVDPSLLLSGCIKKLTEVNFRSDYASTTCSKAAENAKEFGECTSTMRKAKFSHNYAGDKCFEAGKHAQRFGECTSTMRKAKFSHNYAGDKCFEAGKNAQRFAKCTSVMLEANFNHNTTGDKCFEAGKNAENFGECAARLVKNGGSYSHSLSTCFI